MCLLDPGQFLLLFFLCMRAECGEVQAQGQWAGPWPCVYESKQLPCLAQRCGSLHFQGKPWHFISGLFEACPLQNKEEKRERMADIQRLPGQVWLGVMIWFQTTDKVSSSRSKSQASFGFPVHMEVQAYLILSL